MSDLGDEVEKLKKKIEARAYQDRKEEAGSWTHRTREDLSALQRFLAAIGGFLRGLWEVILPAGRGLARVTPWLWRPVRALWNRLRETCALSSQLPKWRRCSSELPITPATSRARQWI